MDDLPPISKSPSTQPQISTLGKVKKLPWEKIALLVGAVGLIAIGTVVAAGGLHTLPHMGTLSKQAIEAVKVGSFSSGGILMLSLFAKNYLEEKKEKQIRKEGRQSTSAPVTSEKKQILPKQVSRKRKTLQSTTMEILSCDVRVSGVNKEIFDGLKDAKDLESLKEIIDTLKSESDPEYFSTPYIVTILDPKNKMLYVWGQAAFFDNQGNWEILSGPLKEINLNERSGKLFFGLENWPREKMKGIQPNNQDQIEALIDFIKENFQSNILIFNYTS